MPTISLIRPTHLLSLRANRAKLRRAVAEGNDAQVSWLTKSISRSIPKALELDSLIRTAAANGWSTEYQRGRRPLGSDTRQRLVFTRTTTTGTAEEISLSVDYSAAVTSIYADIATGPVSSNHIHRNQWIEVSDIAEWLCAPSRDAYPPTEWVLIVGAGYVERRPYETASNYAEYRLTPGVYPVQFVNAMAVAIAPSVKFHDYYVNQLHTASSLTESWEECTAVSYISLHACLLDPAKAPATVPADLTGKAVYMLRANLPAPLQD